MEGVRSEACTRRMNDWIGSSRGLDMMNDKNDFSGNTPTGTKILLTGTAMVERDFLLLTKQNCKLLGGTVEGLVDKWKAERVRGL